MYPKSKNSALMALLAAGGLYAWRNRDKIQSWIANQTAQLNNQNQTSPAFPSTGETRRIGENDYSTETPSTLSERKYGSDL